MGIHMTTATKKIQLGVAALATAAAAAATPVLAQADSMAPLAPSLTSFAEGLGGSAGSAICGPGTTISCASTVVNAAAAQASAVGAEAKANATAPTIFKNSLFWLGNAVLPGPTQNEDYWNDPATLVRNGTFTPLWVSLGKQIFPNLQFWTDWDTGSSQTCFLGFTQSLGGPYSAAGQIRTGYNPKGCNP